MHPYEDEQFLGEHPEVKAKKEILPGSDLDAPPSYDAAMGRHAAGSGEKSSSSQCCDLPDAVSEAGPHTDHKRGVFGRLKDKAIGTKEEREEHRRLRAEQTARAEEEARQARLRELEEREAYMRAHGGYAPYHPSYPAERPGYAPEPATAALLLGGLAGGLLLGDIFGGGF